MLLSSKRDLEIDLFCQQIKVKLILLIKQVFVLVCALCLSSCSSSSVKVT